MVIVLDAEQLFKKDDERKHELLKTISRNGVSDILFSLEKSPLRFSQLMFETKLNPGILNRHLKALQQLKLVEKVEDTYELTSGGKKIVRALEQLLAIF